MNKIICLGDSITKGKVWNEDERRPYITDNSYPGILKKLLNSDVENEGICDINTDVMLKHLGNEIKFDEGSSVIIEMGGNDCNPKWKEIKRDPDGIHDAIVPLGRFKENMVKIINIIKGYGAAPILSTLPPLDADRYFSLLRKVFGMDIKRWIDREGGIYKWQEKYSDAVGAIARKMSIPLIDIRSSFLNTADYKKYMSYDGVHPNEQGYTQIANECCRRIRDLTGKGRMASNILTLSV